MRESVTIAIVLCALLGGCRGADWTPPGGPGRQRHVAAPFVPTEAAFWTTQRGVAFDRTKRRIAFTADGGRTWHVVRRWSVPTSSLSISADRMAAVSTCQNGRRCRLWRSVDAGRTWVVRRGGLLVWSNSRGGQTMWTRIGGDDMPVRLARTTDGGRSWRRVTSPCGHRFVNAFLSPVTPKQAWMVCTGEPGAGSVAVRVFKTDDAGSTWSRLPTGPLGRFGYPSGLTMTATGVGILTEDRGFSYATSDGGRHWRPLRAITAPDTREGISATQLSGTTALVLVFSGDTGTTLYRSTDGDHHWTAVRRWPAP